MVISKLSQHALGKKTSWTGYAFVSASAHRLTIFPVQIASLCLHKVETDNIPPPVVPKVVLLLTPLPKRQLDVFFVFLRVATTNKTGQKRAYAFT